MWSAGVVIGYLPILLMALLVPGFAVAFWDSIRFLFEIKATNLPLPIPWPWRVDLTSPLSGEAIRGVLIGLLFHRDTLFLASLGMFWVVRQKLQRKPVSPALVASSFLALPYAHYAFSRADVRHLAQGIFPSANWVPASSFGTTCQAQVAFCHSAWSCERIRGASISSGMAMSREHAVCGCGNFG